MLAKTYAHTMNVLPTSRIGLYYCAVFLLLLVLGNKPDGVRGLSVQLLRGEDSTEAGAEENEIRRDLKGSGRGWGNKRRRKRKRRKKMRRKMRRKEKMDMMNMMTARNMGRNIRNMRNMRRSWEEEEKGGGRMHNEANNMIYEWCRAFPGGLNKAYMLLNVTCYFLSAFSFHHPAIHWRPSSLFCIIQAWLNSLLSFLLTHTSSYQ